MCPTCEPKTRGRDGRWSEIEEDAVPIYGTEAEVRRGNDGAEHIE